MKIDEVNKEMSSSSIYRMATFNKYKPPKSKQDVINMLSDISNCEYPVFRDGPSDHVKTIAVGKFSLVTISNYIKSYICRNV